MLECFFVMEKGREGEKRLLRNRGISRLAEEDQREGRNKGYKGDGQGPLKIHHMLAELPSVLLGSLPCISFPLHQHSHGSRT